MNQLDTIKKLSSDYSDELLAIRRHLHAYPELSMKEEKTAAFIISKLKEYGIPYQSGIAKTGIVGIIEGKFPGPVIGLRADMDALPIQEENRLDYASCNPGVMHACGHDVHITCLLGAARILNELKNFIKGSIKLIFQPSEESYPGGAIQMIQQGALKNPEVSSMFGQHVFPKLPAGKVGIRSGMYMASTDEIYITVKGKGGHAAIPDQVIDPILIASHIIVAIQQIVSRNASPLMPTVISFGKISGTGRTNIIPDEVKIEGTIRTFNEEWRKTAHDKIGKIAQSLAEGMGGKCEVFIDKGYPFLVNDPALADFFRKTASEYVGRENVVELDMAMTAEDFAYYSHTIPSCFYRLGTRNEEKGIVSNLHTSTFNVDEQSIPLGAGLMAWIAFNQLQ